MESVEMNPSFLSGEEEEEEDDDDGERYWLRMAENNFVSCEPPNLHIIKAIKTIRVLK